MPNCNTNNMNIFFNELSSGKNLSEVKYMSQLYNYVKTKYPDSLVVGNPGGTITDEMSKYADLWLTSEVSADDYINNWIPRNYEFENNPANSSHIVHVIHSAKPEQYETLVNLSKERNAGFLMIINADENAENEDLIDEDDFNRILKLTGVKNIANNLSDGLETEIRGRKDMNLSAGQIQKIGLARALLSNDVKLLLMDEPVANLDIKSEKEISDILKNLEYSVLAVSHRNEVFNEYMKVYRMENGKMERIFE